jgi:hypothetical protein
MSTSGWLTLAETAKALNVSDRTIRRWLRRGKIYGELRAGPNGPQYFFPITHVRALQEPTIARTLEQPHGLVERPSMCLAFSLRDRLLEELRAELHETRTHSHDELLRELVRIRAELTRLRDDVRLLIEERRS